MPGCVGEAFPFDPAWCVVTETDPAGDRQRVEESLLCLADGVIGTRAGLEEVRETDPAAVLAGGLYVDDEEVGERLLALPSWFELPLETSGLETGRRVLDLRDGTLMRIATGPDGTLRTLRFACAARPGVAVLVAEVDPRLLASGAGRVLAATPSLLERAPGGGGVAVASATTVTGPSRSPRCAATIERLATHVVSSRRLPRSREASRRLAEVTRLGAARLLEEQRDSWRQRWAGADVEIVGDAEMTRAVRLALFHLLSSARRHGETAVGSRGLSGPAYAGHVRWDTDVFVVPVLSAVDRLAARAALEYRLRRLGAAQERARVLGLRGARFPGESAAGGDEVTPRIGPDEYGDLVELPNWELDEHVVADVAWSAWRYAAWGGEWTFLESQGRPLLTETARYWASRLRVDESGRAHLDKVVGPDEYHVGVDDDAFTNLMVRWNLRRAAEVVERRPVSGGELEEAAGWRHLAAAVVDHLDTATGIYEQFQGYEALEPRLAASLGEPPLAADLVLDPGRLARTQVIREADVLMAHFLIEEELEKGSLAANLDHYLPRTAHGSSLSPGVHAALLARSGRPDEALELLRVAARVDLDDLTETAAGGLHLASLGAIWQAVVHGFVGLSLSRPDDRHLVLAPVLPEGWEEIGLRLSWHGQPLGLTCRRDAVEVRCERPVTVELHGARHRVEAPGRWIG